MAATSRRTDPAIRPDVAGVVHLHHERHVRPESLTAGLARAIAAAGGRIEHDPVLRLRPLGAGRWVVVTAARRHLIADRVAAGWRGCP